MFSKSFSTVLLASTTALAACGGGGGGGGGLPDVGDNNYFDGFSGQVSTLQTRIQGASVSALVNPSQQDKQTAQEVVDLINNIDTFWNNYKAELSDDVYAVKSQTEEFQEAEAIIELLKGDFLSIANTVAQGGKIDTTVIAKYSDATVVQTEIETKKKNLFHAAIESIETVANVEVSRAVGADSNEREVVKSTTKGAETVTGGVAGDLKRVKTAEVTTVYEKQFDRTTTVILEDQRKITFADGSSRIEVVATRTKSNTVTLSLGTRTATDTVTEEIAHTVAVDAPSEETVTEDPVVTVDRSATYVETYTDAKGNKVTETKVKPVKTTVVKRNKKVTDTKRSTYTYADGHILVVDLEDVVTVTALDDVINTETLAEEVVDTKVEIQLVNEETTQETTVDTVEGEPVFDTTHEDKTTVVEANGNKTTTVTRYYVTKVTTTTTTTTTVNKTTIKTFSNGTTETVVHQPEVSVENKDTVVEDKFTKVISEVVEVINPDSGNNNTDHADMGTRTPGYVADASHYRTDEFSYISNKQLSVSNFDVAYSRGWTGKGSTVVIADTGALTTHTDLDANIKHTVDYTNTTMSDGADHGTHVAGITGAERNGEGMHGAAFDANLAIAKVSSGNFYSFANAIKAAEWGKSLGSAAINVSAEMNYDRAFRSSIVKTAPGEYYSTHWYYGENGYNGAVNEAVKWKAALGDEQVLVKAAGNAGWDYSAGMNQMATATDANGNLVLDGQMIVVGNWDENNNKLNSSSNKAGTVCATMKNGVCIDAAQIKDYYIMANGTAITSTGVNGGYVTMSGTSMAAPVVTGAVAVLHQMWPHMKGKHLVQLVMVTGNKSIAGYDENVHGQGLLDMDRATRPVGATGIPTTGRTNGGVSNISGGAAVGGGVSEGQVTALTGVMLLDSFERDFYVDLGDMTQAVDTRTASVAEQMGAVNYYSGYLGENQLAVPVTLNDNSHIVVGAGESNGHALGNAFSGTLGTTKGSTTMYANYNYQNGGFYAQAGVGVTTAQFDKSGSMLAGADSIVSSTATVGYEFAPKENTTWGFAVSQPVTVESAKMQYHVPTARTLDGRVVHEMRTVDFKSSERELDLGTYYNFNMMGANVNAFAEVRTGVAALQKELEKRVGLSVQYKF